jgi:glycine cleavage system transcriptional repressor
MESRFALSAIGHDRPGIVSAVTEVLFRFGCNIEDSAMTILWGQFAMILVVTPPPDVTIESLREALAAVNQSMALQLSLNPLDESQKPLGPGPVVPYLVSVYGADHPGIVSQTTGFLASRKVNITDLSTRVIQAKGPVYIMLLEVEAPASLTETQLKEDLFSLSQELKVDISLRRLETDLI